MNFQDVLNQAMQLSTLDKVRLIQQMALNIEREIGNGQTNPPQPPAWTAPSEGQRLSNQEVDQARWEDWANFPD